MKDARRMSKWLAGSCVIAIVCVITMHVALRPNPNSADCEQYAVLSSYIEPGLTGESHDLGSRNGLVLIAAKTTFSQLMLNSNKLRGSIKLPQLR